MKIEALHIGMRLRHPQYGVGVVKTLGEHTADIRFDDGLKTVAPETAELSPAEPAAALSGMTMPLEQLVEQVAQSVVSGLGLQRPNAVVEDLGIRWRQGRIVLHPADPSLQTKEIEVEVFFHKIVGMRNQLRVLEQKINANEKLTDAEKVDLQQYITRCYGSMTSFNVLFKNKADQFAGTSVV